LIAIDGTKIAADASFFANRTREQLAKAILAEAERTDAAEDELFGDRSGGELPAQWSGGRGRRGRIRAALDEFDRLIARD
jgi:t-SNARE complex subunit (syntaxin)